MGGGEGRGVEGWRGEGWRGEWGVALPTPGCVPRAGAALTVLVQPAAAVDRRTLDGLVDDLRYGGGVVGVGDLRVEEDLGAQEALVGDIALPLLLAPLGRELLHPLARVLVVLAKLLGHIRTDVAVLFLDALCNVHGVVRGDGRLALAQQQLNVVGDVTAGDRDVLDARADHVAIGHRNNVRHAVAGVHNGARERALLDLLGGPRGGEGEHSLHCDVEPVHIEGLEHDLRRELAILGRVHRRLRQQKVVLLRVAPKVLVDASLPVALHVVPILDDAVPDRIVHGCSRRGHRSTKIPRVRQQRRQRCKAVQNQKCGV